MNQSMLSDQQFLPPVVHSPQQIEKFIFGYLQIHNYQVNNLLMQNGQYVHSVYIPTKRLKQIGLISGQIEQLPNLYIGHGFGGSSLMFFPILNQCLQYSNVILWEVRGMGLSTKLTKYNENTTQQIQNYFMQGLDKIMDFYSHQNIIMMSHSFGAYLTILYWLKQNQRAKNCEVHKLILLSPVGITPKQEDYKNKISSVSDCYNQVTSRIGWAFQLTYKSFLRSICCCFQDSILQKAFKSLEQNQQRQLMVNLFKKLVRSPDGSQTLFFKYFQPRVLPKKSIKPIFKNSQRRTQIICFFGGANDWVDRKGILQLEQIHNQTIKIIEIEQNGHMLPLQKNAMNQVLQIAFKRKAQ